MTVSRTRAEWQAHRAALQGTIGFVPTMGALHAGHAALIRRARAENQTAVVSIFVNPTQFNDPGDLARYPNTLDADLRLLSELGTDHVLLPTPADLYPHGYRYRIEPNTPPALEGEFRPGHLQGVLTVVLKLLNLARATRAYFGEKDFQQLQLVTELAEEFFIDTEIVACPTVREPSGLALSSRNARLSPDARTGAAFLYRALTTARNASEAQRQLEAAGFRVEYVTERWSRRLAAAHLDGVRLIDNVPLPVPETEPPLDRSASLTRHDRAAAPETAPPLDRSASLTRHIRAAANGDAPVRERTTSPQCIPERRPACS